MVNTVQESVDCDKLGQEFNKILNDVEKSLWNGYKKFTKLSSLVTLYNIKVKCGLSYMIFKLVFLVLANMFLEDHKMSNSLYEVKKMLNEFGMGYEKIYACRNDRIFYRKEYANASIFPIRKESRWKNCKVGID